MDESDHHALMYVWHGQTVREDRVGGKRAKTVTNERGSDDAAAVDVEIDPQSCRFRLPQPDPLCSSSHCRTPRGGSEKNRSVALAVFWTLERVLPPVLVRTGRRLPVQALGERRVLVAVTGYPRDGAPAVRGR